RRSERQVPGSVGSAHRYLFSLQSRLLRAPIAPRRRPDEPKVREPETWKEIELPAGEPGPEWQEQAELTVQRALDRFQLVRGQAVHLARRAKQDRAGRLWRKVEPSWAK